MKYTYTIGKWYDELYYVIAKATSKQDALIIADLYRRTYSTLSTPFMIGVEIRRYKGRNTRNNDYEVIKSW